MNWQQPNGMWMRSQPGGGDKVVQEMYPRMETLRSAAAQTGLPYSTLRNLCLAGQVVHIRVGKKFYVNMGRLAEYLNTAGEGVQS